MKDVSFMLRTSHLEKLKAILDDPEADNDRFVA
jgi:fumarate hydratase class I